MVWKEIYSISRKPFVLLIQTYRYFVSPLLGENCRFYPCCSEYAQEAIAKFGTIRGGKMVLLRLLRCHPWHQGGYDPVSRR